MWVNQLNGLSKILTYWSSGHPIGQFFIFGGWVIKSYIYNINQLYTSIEFLIISSKEKISTYFFQKKNSQDKRFYNKRTLVLLLCQSPTSSTYIYIHLSFHHPCGFIFFHQNDTPCLSLLSRIRYQPTLLGYYQPILLDYTPQCMAWK